jgi:hypothetical protein
MNPPIIINGINNILRIRTPDPIMAVIGIAIKGKKENRNTKPKITNNIFKTNKLTFKAIDMNIKNRKIPINVSIKHLSFIICFHYI